MKYVARRGIIAELGFTEPYAHIFKVRRVVILPEFPPPGKAFGGCPATSSVTMIQDIVVAERYLDHEICAFIVQCHGDLALGVMKCEDFYKLAHVMFALFNVPSLDHHISLDLHL